VVALPYHQRAPVMLRQHADSSISVITLNRKAVSASACSTALVCVLLIVRERGVTPGATGCITLWAQSPLFQKMDVCASREGLRTSPGLQKRLKNARIYNLPLDIRVHLVYQKYSMKITDSRFLYENVLNLKLSKNG
jgi:hypothetical protein